MEEQVILISDDEESLPLAHLSAASETKSELIRYWFNFLSFLNLSKVQSPVQRPVQSSVQSPVQLYNINCMFVFFR